MSEQFVIRLKKILDFRNQPMRSFFRNSGKTEGGGVVTTAASHSSRNYSTNNPQNLDEPFKYFGSQAEKIRATPEPPPHPEYSPYIVSISLMVFMTYFCILREENDLDEHLGRDLFDNFGDEASRLKKAYDYNIKHQLPTHEIVSRLREIGAPVPPNMK